MQEPLRLQILDYLERHNTMTLATCAEGVPWAAAVFYANRDFVFYYLSDPKARHSRQIHDNPLVALAVHEDYRNWQEIQGLQIQGRAAMATDETEIAEAWRLYLAKFPFVTAWQLHLARLSPVAAVLEAAGGGAADAARRLSSVRMYRVAASRMLFVDNSKGFGHREELLLEGDAGT